MNNELNKPQAFCGACCKEIVTGKEDHYKYCDGSPVNSQT
jgi:hypothetical protein